MNKNRQGQVIFSEDGTYLTRLEEGDRVIRAEQIEAGKRYAEERQAREKQRKRANQIRGVSFIKQMIDDEIKGVLSGPDSGHALELAVRIGYERIGPQKGFIIMKSINGSKEANFNDLCEIFGTHKGKPLAKKNTSNVIKRLEEKDFLRVTRDNTSIRKKGDHYGMDIGETRFEINPKFFVKGIVDESHVSRTENEKAKFVKIYLKKFRDLTRDLTPAEKGFLLEIAPYFHYSQYVLCRNAQEPSPYELQIFSREDLANELDLSYTVVKSKVAKLKKVGILGEFDSSDVKALYLHPDLVFKQDVDFEDYDYTDKIRVQFELNHPQRLQRNNRIQQQNEQYGLFKNPLV